MVLVTVAVDANDVGGLDHVSTVLVEMDPTLPDDSHSTRIVAAPPVSVTIDASALPSALMGLNRVPDAVVRYCPARAVVVLTGPDTDT